MSDNVHQGPNEDMSTASTVSTDGTAHASNHIRALDGVRAASILLVLIAHTVPAGPSAWSLNALAGAMGMALFFNLSGFLIVSVLERNANAWTFLTKRILRIVPAVAVYVLLMVILFGIGWRAVIENGLFITNYNYDGRGRGEVAAPMTHLWSLSVEMQFYVAIGIAALLMGRRCVWLVPIAMVFITGVRVYYGEPHNIATHLRVDEILSGGTLALIHLRYGSAIRDALSRRSVAITAFVITAAMLLASSHLDMGWWKYTRPYCAALFVGVIIHTHLGLLHDILEGRVARYIARISYALYIYHPLGIWGWMNEGTVYERYLLKRPFSYLFAFAAAHVSTFYWEAYWQRLANRLTRNNRRI